MENRKFKIGDFVHNIRSDEYGFISDFDTPELYRVLSLKNGVVFWAEPGIEKIDKTKYEMEVEILTLVFNKQLSVKNGTAQLLKLGIKEAKYLAREAYRNGKTRRKKELTL